MPRLLAILGVCYAASLIALLAIGIVPGVPWRMLLSFVVHSIPLALTLAFCLTRLGQRAAGRWRIALVPLGVATGLLLVWFFNWTMQPFVIVPLVLFSVWQFVVGSARTFAKPLAFSLLAMMLGYGTVWNVNYLAGRFLPLESLHDQTLLDFDVAFYRAWCRHDTGTQANLFPIVREPTPLRFLEHAYMYYYDEIFLVLFVLLYRGANLTRLFSVMFGCFLIGIPIFLIYPTIGPFTYAPETILPAWHGSNVYSIMKGVIDDWDAIRSGGPLHGYGYFIALPSMHIAIGLVLQASLWKCRTAFWMMLPVNVLLLLSTFLLGLHYVLDAPAGIAVAGITLLAAWLWDRWHRRLPLPEANALR